MPASVNATLGSKGLPKGGRPKHVSTVSRRGGPARTLTYHGTPVSTTGIAPSKAPSRARQVKRALTRVQKAYAHPGGVRGGSPGSEGGTTWTPNETASLARSVGASKSEARTLSQFTTGESGGNPKAVGHDPGGTTGLGLWQITTGYNDDRIAKYGGRGAMLKPKPNAKAAVEILRSSGPGAWYAPRSAPGNPTKPKPKNPPKPKDIKTLQKAGVESKAKPGGTKHPFRNAAGKAVRHPTRIINPKWDPDDDGHTTTEIMKAVSPVAKKVSRKFGITIGATYDPGGGHVSRGHNVTGTSSDVYPSGGWDNPQAMRKFNAGLRTLTNAGFEVFYDGSLGTTAETNHGPGNHAHIEWVPNSENATSPDALKKLAGMTNAQIARLSAAAGGGAVSGVSGTSGGSTASGPAARPGSKSTQKGPTRKQKLRRVQGAYNASGDTSDASLSDLERRYGAPSV